MDIRLTVLTTAIVLVLRAADGAVPSLKLTSMVDLPTAAKTAISKLRPTVSRFIPKLTPAMFPNLVRPTSPRLARPTSRALPSIVQQSVKLAVSVIDRARKAEARLGAADKADSAMGGGFGPHQITDAMAIRLAEFAEFAVETAVNTKKRMRVNGDTQVRQALGRVGTSFLRPAKRTCPFVTPRCNTLSKYRTADGSCNNVQKPLWGKAFTAFERFLPPAYDDQISKPRAKGFFNMPLPTARNISVEVHTAAPVRSRTLSHFSMEFGQFVSHDIQRNALAKGYRGGNMDCCRNKRRRNCFPIPVAVDDEYYRTHNVRCLNFVRALPAPTLDCRLGVRQQLNQNTHFLDGSAIYGSDKQTMNSLRNGAFLRSTGNNDLLPVDPRAVCRTAAKCFKAGDVRVNQQPALMSLQTIWMRHHNNVARRLKQVMSSWNDTTVFEETRKIIGAQLQHIAYNEYLPAILGTQIMNQFDLKPRPTGQYYTKYDAKIKPQIRNAFSAAAYRFGHSMISDHITEKKSGWTINHLLHTVFLKSDLVYNGGVDAITKGLYMSPAYKTDKEMTREVTRHMFETAPKNGMDLAAINVQRGRDHGIQDYNTWKLACGLGLSADFDSLNLHSSAVRKLLAKVYSDHTVFDIDLFTGGVSEMLIPGGNVGPTFACLIGLQFQALKRGDRFFYESNTNVKFPMKQLNELKKTTMAKIICDTTSATSVTKNVFLKKSPSNGEVPCGSLPNPDLSVWNTCTPRDGQWGAWGPWAASSSSRGLCITIRSRTRKCNKPSPNDCGNKCPGSAKDLNVGGTGSSIFDLTGGNCGPIRPGPIIRPPFPFRPPRIDFPINMPGFPKIKLPRTNLALI